MAEYLGEYVRNSVANAREEFYRRMGWGDDYIFRVTDEMLVDATRRGGLARFANHCCEPNCYSRIINVGGKPRIGTLPQIRPDALDLNPCPSRTPLPGLKSTRRLGVRAPRPTL